jgi:uncharacterized protein (TIGR00730 family)
MLYNPLSIWNNASMEYVTKAVCVYSASSDAVSPEYFEAAEELGRRMAESEYTLVYGGGAIGLMGAVARSMQQHGGTVVGVIPEFMLGWGVAYENSDELIVTVDMRERKATMEHMADAFIGLPGGFGTLEELLEVITLKQLGRHNRPIILLNICGFFDCLVNTFEQMYAQNFAKPDYRDLYYLAQSVDDAMRYIRSYQPPEITRGPSA